MTKTDELKAALVKLLFDQNGMANSIELVEALALLASPAPSKGQIGHDWKLSDSAKAYIAEIDRNIANAPANIERAIAAPSNAKEARPDTSTARADPTRCRNCGDNERRGDVGTPGK